MDLNRTVSALCLVSLLGPGIAEGAYNVRFGESFIEQGDYLLAPGVQVALDTGKRRYRFDFTGREFGPFLQATAIASYDLELKLVPWERVTTHYGFSLMDEYTAFDDPHGKKEDIHSFNAGLNLGLGVKVYEGDRWNVMLDWNSHIFAAGLAFIFLTTARKTVFTLSAGYDL